MKARAKSKRAARAPTYHHGDLRAELIRTTRGLIWEKGADCASLRASASLAGVSQIAPYNHFKDKSELLAAVAAESFGEFTKAMVDRADGVRDPVMRLRRLAVGNVEYAVRGPQLVRLMYGSWRYDQAHRELAEASFENAELLAEAVKTCMPGRPRSEIRQASVAAWALVHGLATHCNDGRLAAGGLRGVERRVMAATAHFSATPTP